MNYEELEARCLYLEHKNDILTELAKKDFETISELTDRYIEAEVEMMKYLNLNLFQRIFMIKEYIRTFLDTRLTKYNF